MRKLLIIIVLTLVSSAVFAGENGVLKKTNTEVEFKGFGKYIKTEVQRTIPTKQWKESEQKFKGKGVLGKIAGKFLFRSPRSGEIIDLTSSLHTYINHKKKEYKQIPIKPLITENLEESGESAESPGQVESNEPEKKEKSNIRIIRNEFRVDDTGNKQTLNNFPSNEYVITWVLETENIDTGDRQTDSVRTAVWATPMTDELKKIQAVEKEYNLAYLKKLGLVQPENVKDLLGLNWLKMLSVLSKQPQQESAPDLSSLKELQKIKGYPVLIDGAFYVIFPKKSGDDETAEVEENEESEGGGLKGMFSKFAKKKMKKKKKNESSGLEPLFRYRTEVEQAQYTNLSPGDLAVPAKYKLVK